MTTQVENQNESLAEQVKELLSYSGKEVLLDSLQQMFVAYNLSDDASCTLTRTQVTMCHSYLLTFISKL